MTMQVTRKLRLLFTLQNTIFILLFLALIGLTGYFAKAYHKEWDLTQTHRHTLSEASLKVLGQMTGPIEIVAYATPEDPQYGDIRKIIREFLGPYQKAKKDLNLRFVDPIEQPQAARAAGVQANGELVISFQGRTEHLTVFNEQAMTNALMRLARSTRQLILYSDGHGERKLDGIANHDLGDFGKQLAAKGFKIAPLNLAIAQEVPHNAKVVVLASPQVDFTPDEVKKLTDYVARGGNLLWLIDQEPLHGLAPLEEALGLVLSPGIVIDPAVTPPTAALATPPYGMNEITAGLDRNTLFPFARQIGANEGSGWSVIPLIEVAQRGWLETDDTQGPVSFDKARDVAGPITIGLALHRSVEDRDQRIVVVGSGHFLANAYLGNGGNLDLGINLVNWLAGDDHLIAIQPRPRIDASLELSKTAATLIALGFMIALPVAFIAVAVLLWWRRRKA